MLVSKYLSQLPKPYVVAGLGVSGNSLLSLLESLNIADHNIVKYDDRASEKTVSQKDLLKNFGNGTLFLSPGIPIKSPWVSDYIKNGGVLSSEFELAWSFLDNEKTVGITGSIGKSTTTALLYEGVKSFDPNAFVGGNFGFPLSNYVRDVLRGRPRARWLILELSSYQLENFQSLSLDYSAITYLSPNHMERYSGLDEYYSTKRSILNKTRQFCVLNSNGGDLKNYFGDTLNKKIIWANTNENYFKENFLQKNSLLGEHNLDNLAVAACLANLAQWPESCYSSFKKFPGLPHRLENLGRRKGILFVNDSKSTTIDSVLQAVKSISPIAQQKLFLLIGGRDKNLPWEKLNFLKNHKNLEVRFFGEVAELSQKKSSLSGYKYKTLKETILSLVPSVKSGDVVLLSPGGTSLDEFKNFEERGDFFKSELLKYW